MLCIKRRDEMIPDMNLILCFEIQPGIFLVDLSLRNFDRSSYPHACVVLVYHMTKRVSSDSRKQADILVRLPVIHYQMAVGIEALCMSGKSISQAQIRERVSPFTLNKAATESSGAGANDELMYVNCSNMPKRLAREHTLKEKRKNTKAQDTLLTNGSVGFHLSSFLKNCTTA